MAGGREGTPGTPLNGLNRLSRSLPKEVMSTVRDFGPVRPVASAGVGAADDLCLRSSGVTP